MPAFARFAKTEGRCEVGDSARGADVRERSTSKLGDAARRAARVFKLAGTSLEHETEHQRNFRGFYSHLLFAMVMLIV